MVKQAERDGKADLRRPYIGAGRRSVDAYEAAARIVRATVGRELTAEESERLRALVKDHNIRASWG